MFNVKNMTMESINDSISSLSYIYKVVPIAFKATSQIAALTDAIPHGIIGFLV